MKKLTCLLLLFFFFSGAVLGQNLPSFLQEETQFADFELLSSEEIVMITYNHYKKINFDQNPELPDYLSGFKLWLLDECYNKTLIVDLFEGIDLEEYQAYSPNFMTDVQFSYDAKMMVVDANDIIHIASYIYVWQSPFEVKMALLGVDVDGNFVYVKELSSPNASAYINNLKLDEEKLYFHSNYDLTESLNYLDLTDNEIYGLNINGFNEIATLLHANGAEKIVTNSNKVIYWIVNNEIIDSIEIQTDFSLLDKVIADKNGMVYYLNRWGFFVDVIAIENAEVIWEKTIDLDFDDYQLAYIDSDNNLNIVASLDDASCFRKVINNTGEQIAYDLVWLGFQSYQSPIFAETPSFWIDNASPLKNGKTVLTFYVSDAIDESYQIQYVFGYNNANGLIKDMPEGFLIEESPSDLINSFPSPKTIQPCQEQTLVTDNYGGLCPYQNTVWVGDIEVLDDPYSPTPTFQTCEPGTYNLTYVVEDGEGNIAKAKLIVNVPLSEQDIFIENWDE